MRTAAEINANMKQRLRQYFNAETNYFYGNARYAPGEWRRFVANHERNLKKLQAELYRAQAMQHPGRRTRAARKIQSAYRAHRTGSTVAALRAKLANLRHARDTGNRGNMANIYRSMNNVWSRGGGMNGANLMNNAQNIMFRAGLI